jgi:two-component system, LuxR family, response regulator FixJ
LKKRPRISVNRGRSTGGDSYIQSSTSDRKITVIVVDDDLSVCRALQTQLEILGFKVIVFRSAIKLLARNIALRDVCLLADVYMPEMSGIELSQRLRAGGPELPIILMSGRDDDDTRRIMQAARPVATLFKPFSQEAMLRAIRKATRRSVQGRPF